MEKDFTEGMVKLIDDIRHGDINGTYNIAVATISVLKDIIKNSKWTTADDLMHTIRRNGNYAVRAMPLETCIANMVKRILQIIREEYTDAVEDNMDDIHLEESLHKMLTGEGRQQVDFDIFIRSLKPAVLDHIREVEIELETCTENIIEQAPALIHSNEIIMTIGKSTLVEEFFKRAATTRGFEVIVAEGGPLLHGHEMAANLAKAKIKTTLISDVAIFAMMSRVNKVIIGTHTAMANGGLRAISGTQTVAQAAKHYSVPVMVLLPIYKVSHVCRFSPRGDGFNKQISPLQGVIDSNNAALLEKIHAYNPVFDYVPPDFVTLFISNFSGIAPSYFYRLISELYHPDDYEL